MAQIDSLLMHLKEHDGSDLHLVAGQPPRFRGKGAVRIIEGQGVLSHEALRAMMQEVASHRGWEEYEATGDLDFAFAREERHAAHLAQVDPDRVVGFAE